MRAGEASMTARRVAAHRISATRVAGAHGRPDADQQLQADVASGLEVGASTMGPYLAARTAFFDRVVVEWVAASGAQVVAAGAGYDGRSLRYAAPGVRWFELDHPDTQADKVARLERLGIDAGDVVFAAADFVTEDVAEVLRRVGHDPRRASLFTCEGVAAYLTTDVVSALLRGLRRSAAPGSRLAIELPLTAESAANRHRRSQLRAAVARMGEPLVSAVGRDDLDRLLADGGWRVQRATDPAGVDIGESTRSTAFVVAVPAA